MTTTILEPSLRAARPPREHEWPEQGQWTYEDYRRLPNDGWIYEIIEGELHMAPAPILIHQDVASEIITAFRVFCKKHDVGKAFVAAVDVILPGVAEPVQPDVLFIAKERLHIVKPTRIEGAPDIIVEVLSPSNWNIDRGKKFNAYVQAGVREYWIIDPRARTIELFVLREGFYELLGKYGVGESVRSEVLSGFEVKVEEVCPEPTVEL